jgi:hypothetical protein
VVDDLVQGVNRDPGERAFLRCGVVVDDLPPPVRGREPVEHVAEQQGGVAYLPHDVTDLLVGVSVVLDALEIVEWLTAELSA